MKMTCDRQSDVAYVRLADGPVTETEEVAPGIVLDFDDHSHMLGTERWREQRSGPGVLANTAVAAE